MILDECEASYEITPITSIPVFPAEDLYIKEPETSPPTVPYWYHLGDEHKESVVPFAPSEFEGGFVAQQYENNGSYSLLIDLHEPESQD